MGYTIGFDLGTHQTKICIENSDNPTEKVYEFLEFERPDRTRTVLFPSIVQINNDDTLSYGFIDDTKCKIYKNMEDRPILKKINYPFLPGKPKKIIPEYPLKPKQRIWQSSLQYKRILDKWKKDCYEIEQQVNKLWKLKCDEIDKDYLNTVQKIKEENARREKEYAKKMKQWEQGEKLQFRYFKLKAMAGVGNWSSTTFTAKEITVWYITYILLILKEKYNNNFSIQFGVPIGGNEDRDNTIVSNAYSLYIAAWKLSENFSSLEEYKSSTYLHLRELTDIKYGLTDEEINQYIFDYIPEAFAGLIAVTQQRKIGIGFHLLADIGGGTTDIALFYVKSQTLLPDVIATLSFSQGLNFIFERTFNKYPKYVSLEILQDKFLTENELPIFKDSINEYNSIFEKNTRTMINLLFDAFYKSSSKHGYRQNSLKEAINGQPIIYCGGGALYSNLHFEVDSFTDTRCIDKKMLNIKNIKNASSINEEIYPILATSYGLASYGKIDEIKFTSIGEVFDHLKNKDQSSKQYTHDYGIDDT